MYAGVSTMWTSTNAPNLNILSPQKCHFDKSFFACLYHHLMNLLLCIVPSQPVKSRHLQKALPRGSHVTYCDPQSK